MARLIILFLLVFSGSSYACNLYVEVDNEDTNVHADSVVLKWDGGAVTIIGAHDGTYDVNGNVTLEYFTSSPLIGDYVFLEIELGNGDTAPLMNWESNGVTQAIYASQISAVCDECPDVEGVFCDANGDGPNDMLNAECVCVEPILPVDFVKVSATAKKGYNTVSWEIANEIDNSKYHVEKSINSYTWRLFSEVLEMGSLEYGVIDNDPFLITYYRIKQIDLDGSFSYSPVFSATQEEGFEVEKIEVYDRLGRIVQTVKSKSEIKNSIELRMIRIYFINGKTLTEKIIKP